eukprot:3050594-Rhodomonas_salina.1
MIDEVFVRVLQYVRSASADGRALWGEFHTDSLFASLPLYPCSITQLPPSKSLAAAVAPQFLIRFSQSRRRLSCKHAAALYAQAADFNKTARFYYMKAQDAYYLANAQASYDDWRRARRQWDYFYRRK